MIMCYMKHVLACICKGGGGPPPPTTIHSAQYGDESMGCKLICSPQDMVCNNKTVICALYRN
jgi:hypothetical protein